MAKMKQDIHKTKIEHLTMSISRWVVEEHRGNLTIFTMSNSPQSCVPPHIHIDKYTTAHYICRPSNTFVIVSRLISFMKLRGTFGEWITRSDDLEDEMEEPAA